MGVRQVLPFFFINTKHCNSRDIKLGNWNSTLAVRCPAVGMCVCGSCLLSDPTEILLLLGVLCPMNGQVRILSITQGSCFWEFHAHGDVGFGRIPCGAVYVLACLMERGCACAHIAFVLMLLGCDALHLCDIWGS